MITHDELSPGYQAVQSSHAAIDFCFKYPEFSKVWHEESNSIIILAVKNEIELYEILQNANYKGISNAAFFEPDIGYALTAIAIEPTRLGKQFCADFSVAMKPKYCSYAAVEKGLDDAPQVSMLNDFEKRYRKEKRVKQVVKDMSDCEQSKGQSVLDHGLRVNKYLHDIIDNYIYGKDDPDKIYKVPEWLVENKDLFRNKLKTNFSNYIIDKYTIFHDCGKPYCLTTDEHGQKHFLNHQEMSAKTWRLKISGSSSEDDKVSRLIEQDMHIHTIKAKDVSNFAARPESPLLILSGLAEIYANAEMFGGTSSSSFKIKYKQIERRGKAIIKAWKEMSEIFDI